MERLKALSDAAVRRVSIDFKRYLFEQINWDRQLIGISGARGGGKTVMLLQYLKLLPKSEKGLYISLDDVYFTDNKLVYFAEDYAKYGGTVLLIDEVHKYPNWSQELKNIYDNIPDLKVVFTSSSALEIHKGSHDLSRRARIYNLFGLSFREFVELKYKHKLPILTVDLVLENHLSIVNDILGQIKPLPLFKEYLKSGYYPFFLDSDSDYLHQLTSTINLVLESDLPAIHRIDFNSILKMKNLLYVISKIVPFKPNIEKLSSQTNTTRETLLKYLYYLDRAQVIKLLGSDSLGINYLNRPKKIFLGNTNIAYALSDNNVDVGNIRETFFINQLSVNNMVTYSNKGDFKIDNKYIFEIGGKNKDYKQIAGLKDSFIAADDIDSGFGNKIPIWLFGMLY